MFNVSVRNGMLTFYCLDELSHQHGGKKRKCLFSLSLCRNDVIRPFLTSCMWYGFKRWFSLRYLHGVFQNFTLCLVYK